MIATMAGMRALGATIAEYDNYIVIEGIGRVTANAPLSIDCNESGSTLRFFIPIFSLANQEVTFLGKGRLFDRPQAIYQEIFQKQGLLFEQTKESITINGRLQSGDYEILGNVSSQFVTGLVLALTMLQGDSTIRIKPPFESRSYVNLTLQTMQEFGVTSTFVDETTIAIKGNQLYHATDYVVEGDYSQMAFFAVMSAIKGRLQILGMREHSAQGDRELVEILRRFGATITYTNHQYDSTAGPLICTDIDLADCPDLGPILMVLCAFSKGTTTIYNAQRLRIKESDRIQAMETELQKLGVQISSTEDSVTISGRTNMQGEVTVFAHNDHRIAMSLAVFASCCEYPIIIEGAECVDKSYPNFFDDIKSIGVELELYS